MIIINYENGVILQVNINFFFFNLRKTNIKLNFIEIQSKARNFYHYYVLLLYLTKQCNAATHIYIKSFGTKS